MNKQSNEEIFVAIHQPNLFPWLGFFDKINRSDIFIILDHVVNNPRDPLWTKRVQIISNGKPFWLTIPLEHSKNEVFYQINKIKINSAFIPKKHLRTIQQNYQKSPYFDSVFPYIEKYYLNSTQVIAKRNIEFIKSICKGLNIKTKLLLSSEMSPQFSASDLLIELIKKIKGDKYLYGGLGADYQENEKFEKADIELISQNFQHPIYPQFNTKEFVKGLSIIDALMNVGFDGVKELLND